MKGFGLTHKGLVRTNNQDAFYYNEENVAAVFDGVGGAKFGEVASKIAVDVVSQSGQTEPLVELLTKIQQTITETQAVEPKYEGMATTAVIARFKRGYIEYSWSGDSRLYMLKGCKLVQLTKDHTIAQDFVDRKVLTKEEAKTSNISSHLTSCLSANDKFFKPCQGKVSFKTKKRFLFCSDGLTDAVQDEIILQLIKNKSVTKAGELLLNAALGNGAPDNVTIIIFDVPGKYL
ncbi:PP2C family protein-serine/threonine phosphatase [Thalassotalea hakodatensis]|uniref:PP2C family protein-serine/threonine phosphatase n=1 Tax=Thalassotalea hakodatensis TaxID=3030492 RepID=UPI002573A5F3|nr:protein phosphatase 2C domain-containing protein [Thalassotalea hakodatensis]